MSYDFPKNILSNLKDLLFIGVLDLMILQYASASVFCILSNIPFFDPKKFFFRCFAAFSKIFLKPISKLFMTFPIIRYLPAIGFDIRIRYTNYYSSFVKYFAFFSFIFDKDHSKKYSKDIL